MSDFDPRSTTPGLAMKSEPSENIVHMKCRGKSNCDSMQAAIIELKGPSHSGQRMYRCVKCNHTWGLSMGGHLNL